MIIEDKGIIVSVKEFEERYLVVHCLLKQHGLMGGLVRISKASRSDCLLGNIVDITWKARLRDQLGYYQFDLCQNIFASSMADRINLVLIRSSLAITSTVLHENEKQLELFEVLEGFLRGTQRAAHEESYKKYLMLEICVLKASGFGLSLDKCAISGSRNNLRYISRRSGAIVTEEIGRPYADKSFKAPDAFIHSLRSIGLEEFLECLYITGFFIEKNILSVIKQKMPIAREILLESIKKMALKKL